MYYTYNYVRYVTLLKTGTENYENFSHPLFFKSEVREVFTRPNKTSNQFSYSHLLESRF